jgi:hypothetical protein
MEPTCCHVRFEGAKRTFEKPAAMSANDLCDTPRVRRLQFPTSEFRDLKATRLVSRFLSH